MTLDYSINQLSLPLDTPFTIERGTTEVAELAVLQVTDGETAGIGAAAPSSRYGETIETVLAILPDLMTVVERLDDVTALRRLERDQRAENHGVPAARAAISIALHDYTARRVGEPLYRRLGLDPTNSLTTSFTLGLASPSETADRAQEAVEAGYETLKIKLGTGHGAAVIEAVREAVPEATLRVDANEAWTPRTAVDQLTTLAEYDIQFIEQPVSAANSTGLEFVADRSPIPIAADESCLLASDVPEIANWADIAVVKLMKTGGIQSAIETIHTAQAHGLEVMLGCMIESDASLAAAAHLTPCVDYADLDGSLKLARDPYRTVPIEDGEITLDQLSADGTGVPTDRPTE